MQVSPLIRQIAAEIEAAAEFHDTVSISLRIDRTTPRVLMRGFSDELTASIRKGEQEVVAALLAAHVEAFQAICNDGCKQSCPCSLRQQGWINGNDAFSLLVCSALMPRDKPLPLTAQAKFTDAQVGKFFELFVPPNCNATYRQREKIGNYTCLHRAPALKDFQDHLQGIYTFGIPLVGVDGFSICLTFDEDTKTAPGARCKLDVIEEALLSARYKVIREGARLLPDGVIKPGHLRVHFSRPIAAKTLRKWAHVLLKGLRLMTEDGKLSEGLECFPKQDVAKDGGAQVRLPFGIHRKSDAFTCSRIGMGELDCHPIDQLDHYLSTPTNDPSRIERAVERLREDEPEPMVFNLTPFRSRPTSGITALSMVEELRQDLIDRGEVWLTQCPLCRAEGHDISGDNLQLRKDGTTYGCWFGGWNEVHKYKNIYKALLTATGNWTESRTR